MLHRVHLCGIGTDRDRKTGALRARLAHNDASGLNYAVAAFIALASEERAQFLGELERLTTSWAAFKSSRMLDVKWCHPKLLVEVKHLAGSKAVGHLIRITAHGHDYVGRDKRRLFLLTRERTRRTNLFIEPPVASVAAASAKATPFSATMRRASVSAGLPPRASFNMRKAITVCTS